MEKRHPTQGNLPSLDGASVSAHRDASVQTPGWHRAGRPCPAGRTPSLCSWEHGGGNQVGADQGAVEGAPSTVRTQDQPLTTSLGLRGRLSPPPSRERLGQGHWPQDQPPRRPGPWPHSSHPCALTPMTGTVPASPPRPVANLMLCRPGRAAGPTGGSLASSGQVLRTPHATHRGRACGSVTPSSRRIQGGTQ